ncbi:hypothetical protein M3P05_12410 [Sansalvadorimonas sp. 2012CJ34-2]|uniref:Uncharacterized protein n=1 Tax=Parendozoicomonas callyspongiae TaxID=2942213 RepID=A0ABT0PJ01_9GAMM|nr:hypothetical protein [Sansalvadorimonas sp. 2012CJ34-2]MCL6270727.1 hypothetical protein [Sansalvadorimonas sp. 2012CJ34-2]
MASYNGDGTQANPYLIETPEQMRDAFQGGGGHYEVIKNIDMGGMDMGGYFSATSWIDGKGHVVSNAGQSGSSLYNDFNGRLYNLHVQFIKTGPYEISRIVGDDYGFFENVRFEFMDGQIQSWAQFRIYGDRIGSCTGVIINEYHGSDRTTYWCNSGNTKIDVSATDTDPASYPGIDSNVWDITGGSVPVLIPQSGDYSAYTHVMGTTLVDGNPVSRIVRAVGAGRHELISETTSGADGSYDLQTSPYTHGVLVYTFDDYGTTLLPGTVYELDDITHPKGPNGYRYICVQAGTTGDPLPDAPWPTDQLITGTAIFNAEKIVQPFMHGPVTPVPIYS